MDLPGRIGIIVGMVAGPLVFIRLTALADGGCVRTGTCGVYEIPIAIGVLVASAALAAFAGWAAQKIGRRLLR